MRGIIDDSTFIKRYTEINCLFDLFYIYIYIYLREMNDNSTVIF